MQMEIVICLLGNQQINLIYIYIYMMCLTEQINLLEMWFSSLAHLGQSPKNNDQLFELILSTFFPVGIHIKPLLVYCYCLAMLLFLILFFCKKKICKQQKEKKKEKKNVFVFKVILTILVLHFGAITQYTCFIFYFCILVISYFLQ